MTEIAASKNGYKDTLAICREHIEDASAAVVAMKNMLNAFCESYVDVRTDVFTRRAAISHNEYASIFNIAMESLHDVSSILGVARGLVTGAAMISASEETETVTFEREDD